MHTKYFLYNLFPIQMPVWIDSGCTQTYGLIPCNAAEIANESCAKQHILEISARTPSEITP